MKSVEKPSKSSKMVWVLTYALAEELHAPTWIEPARALQDLGLGCDDDWSGAMGEADGL